MDSETHFSICLLYTSISGVMFEGYNENIYRLCKEAGLEAHYWKWTMNRRELLDKHPDWYAVNRKGESCHGIPVGMLVQQLSLIHIYNYLPYDEYMEQEKGFTASKYDPKNWVDLIKESGAKYTVITTKHHDGVALWDTKVGDISVVKSTPAKRDLIAPFVKEVRKQGLKLGFYYSLLDWSHPDYPNKTRTEVRYKNDPCLLYTSHSSPASSECKTLSTSVKPAEDKIKGNTSLLLKSPSLQLYELHS